MAKTERIILRLEPELLEGLDSVRGAVGRSEYVRGLIEKAVGKRAKRKAAKKGETPLPSIAKAHWKKD